jgi:hypothetical protein
MNVDNKVRNAGEDLASPSQGWLVLWVQYENYHNWSTEITFDRRLREDLLKLPRKRNGWCLQRAEGPKIISFMFEFTEQPVNVAPLDIRVGNKRLREIGELV